MYMFLLDLWAWGYIGNTLGRFIGRFILTPAILVVGLWLGSPIMLAWLVKDRVVRPWLWNRKSRKLQGITYV